MRKITDYSNLTIQKDVPVPTEPYFRETGLSATMRQMEIGDSIVLPFSSKGAAQQTAGKLKIKVMVRPLDSTKTQIRVWKTGVVEAEEAPAPAVDNKGKKGISIPGPALSIAGAKGQKKAA